MKTKSLYFICTVLFVLGLSTAQGAITFDLNNEVSRSGILNSTFAYQYNYSEMGVDLEVTGWTDTASIAQQYVGQWNGLGDENLGSPGHAIDNSGGYDMLLLCFDQSVSLESVSFGWGYNDTDMSVLALTGGSFSDFTGENWADLLSEGWESAGNYQQQSIGSQITIVPDLNAKYWLVGAYNDSLGGTDYYNHIGEGKHDYFKLKTATITPATPVPSSMLLAFTGLALIRRFRKKAV